MIIRYLLTIALVNVILNLSGCATVNQELEKQMSLQSGKPIIEYNAEEVIVSYFYNRFAPVRSRSVILGSNVHGANISRAAFKIERNRYEKGVKYVAHLPMPSTVPQQAKDVCFYVRTDRGQVIPAKKNQGNSGFVNTLWQHKYASPVQINALKAENQNLSNQLHQLLINKRNAEKYVASSSLVENGHCKMPKPEGAKPQRPYSTGFESKKKEMAYLECMEADIAGLNVDQRYQVINQNIASFMRSITDKTVQKHINDMSKYNAVKELSNNARDYYSENLRTNKKSNFSQAMLGCVRHLENKVNRDLSTYKESYSKWSYEPIRRNSECKAHFDLLNTAEYKTEALNDELNKNTEKLSVLDEQVKAASKKIYLPEYAGKTVCTP